MGESTSFLEQLKKRPGKLNVQENRILSNMASSIRRGLPQCIPHQVQKKHLMLVGGGPSLPKHEEEIRQLRREGSKIVALNGAGKWLMDREIVPSAVAVMDANAYCARFVEKPIAKCRYLLASQCDPVVFDECAGRDTWIFHCHNGIPGEDNVLREWYGPDQYYWVGGGCTVALRVIWLMRMLGFTHMSIFGVDSCYTPQGQGHAYDQPEGVGMDQWAVRMVDHVFHVTSPMGAQYYDLLHFIRAHGDKFWLDFRGDGLLATMMREACKAQQKRAAEKLAA